MIINKFSPVILTIEVITVFTVQIFSPVILTIEVITVFTVQIFSPVILTIEVITVFTVPIFSHSSYLIQQYAETKMMENLKTFVSKDLLLK